MEEKSEDKKEYIGWEIYTNICTLLSTFLFLIGIVYVFFYGDEFISRMNSIADQVNQMENDIIIIQGQIQGLYLKKQFFWGN